MKPDDHKDHTDLPTAAELEWRILEAANEDSWGLWESCWSLRTDFSLEQSDAQLSVVVGPVMRKLIKRGLVVLYRNQWTKGEYLPVSMDQADVLLSDPVNWSPPPNNEYWAVWFGATDAGRHAWRVLQEQRGKA